MWMEVSFFSYYHQKLKLSNLHQHQITPTKPWKDWDIELTEIKKHQVHWILLGTYHNKTN